MSTPQGQRRIVVGIDGSPEALAAVRWAAAEAVRRGASLRLVTSIEWLDRPAIGPPIPGHSVADSLFELAGKGLDEAADAAKKIAPEVGVDREAVVGYPVAVLAGESRHAGLLVVGASGHGRITSLVAGSVAVGVATHASCPVVVVRGEDHGRTAPVVVSVDPSHIGEAAIAFAFEAVSAHGVPLIAVHTWGFPPGDGRTAPMWGELIDDAERELAESLAGWTEKYPDVPVRRIVSHSTAARRLIDLSEEAQLVVVGSRGHGELVGLVLGSVSNAVVHRAACPVAVVRPART
ncbi:nucleotide-binding universal stress UspA family protein [Pseudonocardia hierapolitana]|uniref:Nucleotide-binding universal stress UspA family protein n=1 Tax=Pseudonocardia hierapolitana TaxID=1128676 RepID=A0A561T567_9PSEU|nr:universal stress protein [Pseudonocardia hierapolitana]TWF82257.1 nucleotide-binding universal stress UspA family protein [Pseudonocardia hierapolitana]